MDNGHFYFKRGEIVVSVTYIYARSELWEVCGNSTWNKNCVGYIRVLDPFISQRYHSMYCVNTFMVLCFHDNYFVILICCVENISVFDNHWIRLVTNYKCTFNTSVATKSFLFQEYERHAKLEAHDAAPK